MQVYIVFVPGLLYHFHAPLEWNTATVQWRCQMVMVPKSICMKDNMYLTSFSLIFIIKEDMSI